MATAEEARQINERLKPDFFKRDIRLGEHDTSLAVQLSSIVSHDTLLGSHSSTLIGHENSLVSHNSTLASHGGTLTSLGQTAQDHENRITSTKGTVDSLALTANNHETRITNAQNAANAASNLAGTKVDLGASQDIGGVKRFVSQLWVAADITGQPHRIRVNPQNGTVTAALS